MKYHSTVPTDLYRQVSNILTTSSGQIILYTQYQKKSRIKPPFFIALSEIQYIKLKNDSICLIISKHKKKEAKSVKAENNSSDAPPDYYVNLAENPAVEASLKTARFIPLNGKLVWYGKVPKNAIPANISNFVKGTYYALETNQWYWRTPKDKLQFELKQILAELAKRFEQPYPHLKVIYTQIGKEAIQWLLNQTGYTYLYWNTAKNSQPQIKLTIKSPLLSKSHQFTLDLDPQNLHHYPNNFERYKLLVIPNHTTCSDALTKNILQTTEKIEGSLIVYTLSLLYKIRHQLETESVYVFASLLLDCLPWERLTERERQEYEFIFEQFWFDTISQDYKRYNQIEFTYTLSQKLGIYLQDPTPPDWLDKDQHLSPLVGEVHALLDDASNSSPYGLFNTLKLLWLYYHDAQSKMKNFCGLLAHFLLQQIEVELGDFSDVFSQYFKKHHPFLGKPYSFPDLVSWKETLPSEEEYEYLNEDENENEDGYLFPQ